MKDRNDQIILEIKNYLDLHLGHVHSIADLCSRFSINREKLQNGFRGLVDLTVHAYILRQRLGRAAKRLRESDDPIKSIAIESGYKKQRSFNKTFKTIYQMTPAAYRHMQKSRIVRLDKL